MDTLLASYLMTRENRKLEKSTFFQICMHGENEDNSSWSADFILEKIKHIRAVLRELEKKGSAYNGMGLISMMLPNTFNYTKKTDANPAEPILRIRKGVMYEGALSKAAFGSHNSIIQCLEQEYGYKTAAKFVDNLQFVGVQWITQNGFSIGISDCIPKNTEFIQNNVYKGFIEAKSISESNQHPRIVEAKITNTLSKIKDIGLKIAKDSMDPDNSFISTVVSGSKGDFFNIAQITGLLGQQNLAGGRIQPTLNKGKRTLPYYHFKNLDIEKEYESRGFVRNSFMKGLNPREFFLHAMSGREGVSDTAMKTSSSGYIQRRMIKLMEDLQVKYDGTVRNASGSIVQWSYGTDGFDRSKTIIKNDQVEMCDISRLVDKLNTEYELGM
jgi:DNA-directed RNA polymerase II subunit RPB1